MGEDKKLHLYCTDENGESVDVTDLTQQRDRLQAQLEMAQDGNLVLMKRCNELSDNKEALEKHRDDLLAVCEAVVKAKDLLVVSSECVDEFAEEARALTSLYDKAKSAISGGKVR